MFGRVEVGFDVLGELTKALGLGVDGTLESTDRHFVIVAGIDHQHFRIGNQGVPVLGLDIGADQLVGIDARHAESNDLFFSLTLLR